MNMKEKPLERYYNIEEASRYLGITSSALRNRIQRKQVDVFYLGRRILIEKATLDGLLSTEPVYVR
jgi:excisionase family DNA binding protein|tara:strand:+ start:300 stop:497 length:198 start_codon:yes stop_codon:yes gene_type:complete